MNGKTIKSIANCMKKYLNNLDCEITKRKRKLTIINCFIHSVHRIKECKSHHRIINTLKCDNIINATPQAIQYKLKKVNPKKFQQLNDILINKFFNKHSRIFAKANAVDGSKLAISKEVLKTSPQFKLTPNQTYVNGLLTTIYDVQSKIPIATEITESSDERKAFINLIHYVKPGDIVIFDRGYFSSELLDCCRDKKIDAIFRLKKSFKFVKELVKSKNDQGLFNYKDRVIRIISYKINDQEYYLGTTLLNSMTIILID